MPKKLSFFILLFSVLFFSGCTVPGFGRKNAGLKVAIVGNEPTTVFLDGLSKGKAPVDAKDIKPGTYTLRLVPEDSTKPPYETSVKFQSDLVTVVQWNFGKSIDESGGEIFEMEKLSNKNKSELSVVTNPDNVVVKLDQQSKGFSPLLLSDVESGEHELTLTAPGYIERTIKPNIEKGHRIVVTIKLQREPLIQNQEPLETPEPSSSPTASVKPSASPKASPKNSPSPAASASASPKASASPTATPKPSASPSSQTPDFPYVEITETGTGWLRVRAEASSAGEEVARLNVGDKVPYLDETVSGWHKVEYETGKEGWVSGQYAIVHKQ